MANFVTSLDDFATIQSLVDVKDGIDREIKRRQDCAADGICWYCGRTFKLHTCKTLRSFGES